MGRFFLGLIYAALFLYFGGAILGLVWALSLHLLILSLLVLIAILIRNVMNPSIKRHDTSHDWDHE